MLLVLAGFAAMFYFDGFGFEKAKSAWDRVSRLIAGAVSVVALFMFALHLSRNIVLAMLVALAYAAVICGYAIAKMRSHNAVAR